MSYNKKIKKRNKNINRKKKKKKKKKKRKEERKKKRKEERKKKRKEERKKKRNISENVQSSQMMKKRISSFSILIRKKWRNNKPTNSIF